METITVRIQGESDWVQTVLNVQELKALKDSGLHLPIIAGQMGKMLDRGFDSISPDDNKKLINLLSKYVGNLKVFNQMQSQELGSLIITSFRAGKPFVGYWTRVAGAIRGDIRNASTITLDDRNFPSENIGYLILLKMISSNPCYKTDKYHSKSNYHLIREQATQVADLITII